MAAVDHERVVLALKAHLGTKRSFGADELRVKITELEVECSRPESVDEHDLLRAATSGRHEEATSTSRPASAIPA